MHSKMIGALLVSALLAFPATLAARDTAGSDAPSAEPAEQGIWIGNLDLCRSGRVEAEAGTENYSGLPVVSITLPAELRDALAALTAANIGKPLSIRVDGKVVSEPHVNEPISGGQLQISGLDSAEAHRIAAALQGCPAETARTTG